jgi:uncharacterized membrane protein YeiB
MKDFQRIVFVDALRGFALLGINLYGFQIEDEKIA